MGAALMLTTITWASEIKNEIETEETKAETRGDVTGETFNFAGGKKETDAVAYGKGSNGGYGLEAVQEVPTATNYYDGEKKLNTIKIKCKIHANPTECLHHSSCGWCSASNSCIIGNNMGPLEPCVKSSFIFSAPYPNFNPKTKVINENVGGLSMTVITK